MNAKQFATEMKEIIEEAKSKGIVEVPCDNIIAYLDHFVEFADTEPNPHEVEQYLEQYRAKLQAWVEQAKHGHATNLEMFRSVIATGQSAIRSSFLLNGGASVALLAFIGHLAQFNASKLPVFAGCLLPFAFGILAIVVTSGATYLSQLLYADRRPWARKIAVTLHILSVVLGIASYVLFSWGVLATYHALVVFE